MSNFVDELLERLCNELAYLNDNRDRLIKFVGSDRFDGLCHKQRVLLRRQLRGMDMYATALEERIALLLADEVPY